MENYILSEKAKEVLSSDNTRVLYLLKIPQIEDSVYDQLVDSINSIGGTWSERNGGFLFDHDPNEDLKTLRETGTYSLSEIAIWKEKTQFYPTPTWVCEHMVEMAELTEGDVVLEPSAGEGAILECLPDYVESIAIEYDKKNLGTLRGKGYNVIWGDFMKVGEFPVSKVIMNPPFSNMQDVKHFCKAYRHLKKGGVIVAVINDNSLVRMHNNPAYAEFKSILDTPGATIQRLPEGTFVESGTMINTAIIKIRKPI